ncbi:hypothetical protein [Limosilactobacillus equigenerosi]|uniref:Uncharacterized protein n=1 Tax=Limosilactobacillus equigenerosi DSM 18793 = JCM 14505 TaxID=1423742 RepID=A0A0R1UG11_9LACO|nr:hypothetical protein [Limosilactobacillus equigenerosi]KRL92311.1 hypothetical protein FC21_GL000357 [Limosilactobacillus equigenerosi DSM 18793 = JCM 14505]
MELLSTILTAILVAIVGAIGGYLNRNDKARTIALTLDLLAKDPVVSVEKLSSAKIMDGKTQALKAWNILEHEIDQLSFTDVQLEQISNAIEHAWA